MPSLVPRLQILAAALLFSTGGMAIKACELTDWQVSSFRCAIGAAAMWLLLPQARQRWTWPTVAVGAAYAATMVLYALANKATTAANAIFLQSTAPLYILLLAPFLLGERNRRRDLLVMVGMGAGLLFFFFDENAASATAPEPVTGNLMAAAAGVSWALTVMGLRWLENRPGESGRAPVAVVAGNLIAALICLPQALPVLESRPADWLWVAYLGVFQIAVAYVLLTTALGRVRALEASLLLLVEPVFNPVWTFLALGEIPGPLALVGCGIILLTTVAKSVGDAWLYRRSRPGGGADDPIYAAVAEAPPTLAVEVRLRAALGDPAAARVWCAGQTLGSVQVVGLDAAGGELWRVDRRGECRGLEPPPPFFMAPEGLPELIPAHLESAALVLAAETVDAVALPAAVLESTSDAAEPAAERAGDLATSVWRPWTLFRADVYDFNPATGGVEPRAGRQVVKVVCRRDPYLSSFPSPARPTIGIRDLTPGSPAPAGERTPGKTRVLVTAPFLARGGAEHTLFETLRALGGEFEYVFATLAHHLPEIGDRRADFRRLDERLYCLGDLVHPAAMVGILLRLIDEHRIEVLYNANSTTLFYDFAPRLKAACPDLLIVDHLYDHRVGYIERYADPALLECVDACVAENRRIAEVLVEKRGWPAQRVPVIWPCGRARDAFPADPEAVRERLRRELGVGPGEVLILTAARLHSQKRPLDLVALAARAAHLPVRFLLVGGGPLEAEVEAALAAAPEAPITRLPFREDVPDLICAADAGCLISEYEGLPVFLLECLQLGRPFLGTDVGDLGYVLRETGAGIVVERPGDLDALLLAVERLADAGERAGLAERARAAGREFDVEACAARYAAALRGGREGD